MSKDVIARMRATIPACHPGWGGPEYTSWQDEQLSWQHSCYLGDWSFLHDIEVTGSDALKVFSDTGVNSCVNFPIGRAQHLVQCNAGGKVIGDGVLMRLGENRFRTQANTAFWTAFVLSKGGYDAQWRAIDTFQLQVSGPSALAVCEKATGESLGDIRRMHFRKVRIAGCELHALRHGVAGSISFEFHGSAADSNHVRAALLQAGEPFGIRRLGRRTAMISHLEAAYPTAGWHYLSASFGADAAGFADFVAATFDRRSVVTTLHGSFAGADIDEYTFSPFELGWGNLVRFDHDFAGRQALQAEAADPKRRRVTLRFNSEDMTEIYASLFRQGQPYDFLDMPHPQRWMVWADAVLQHGEIVGISSAPGYSFNFRSVLSLAFIDAARSAAGTQLEVLWGNTASRQKRIRATVHPAPFKLD